MKNLSWGRLTIRRPDDDAIVIWLGYMANKWVDASNIYPPDEETSITPLVENLEKRLRGVLDEGRRMAHPYILHPWWMGVSARVFVVNAIADAMEKIANAILGLDKQVQIGVEQGRLSNGTPWVRVWWDGVWTPGRYVAVTLRADHASPTLVVEWDTATGQESTFLGLPQSAQEYASEHEQCELRALVNQYRRALESVGIDVTDIPERGCEGVRQARQVWEEYVASIPASVISGGEEACCDD